MAVQDELQKISDGDQLDDGYFNGVVNFAMKNQIVMALAQTTVPALDNFFYSRFYENTETTTIDDTNSDCCYADISATSTNSGGAWFCTQYDQFDDASFSAVNWTSSTSAGPGGTAISSVTESGISVDIHASQSDAGTSTTSITSDGSTGLDMRGQDGEIFFFARRYNLQGGPDASSYTLSRVRIGTTTIHDEQVNNNGANLDTTADYRLVFNNSAETVDLYKDGTKIASAIDISSEANWYFSLLVESHAQSSSGAMRTHWVVYSVGYVKDGDSNSVNFVTDGETASASSNAMIAKITTDGGTSTITGSCNGGSNYSSLTDSELGNIGTAGTGIKLKVTQTVPSITNTTTNIKKLTDYGVFYD